MSSDSAHEASDPIRLVSKPLVSVLMITYNHAEYLADAIEGVVTQHCDFPFELIIGEDASKDATLEVALTYQQCYPEIVRVIHSAANVGGNANSRRIFERARGEFVAYCEGDDYWCRRDKLARQIELIRGDPRIGIVHTDWVRSRFENGAWRHNPEQSVHRRVPLRLLQGDLSSTWHFPKVLRTCTVLLRRETVQKLYASDLGRPMYKFGDSVRNAFVAMQWRVAYLPSIAAVYRVSPNSALRSGARARVEFYNSSLEFDSDARAFFAGRSGYNDGYRWETGMGLLLWSLLARDANSVLKALRGLKQHFGPLRFIAEGCRAVSMRWPTLRKQPRDTPDALRPASQETTK